MATTEVLLTQRVDNLGAEGEKVRVKAGYARNYLLPKKIAMPVNRVNRRQVEALQKARVIREEKELQAARDLAERLDKARIAIAVKTGEGGRMFGAVTAQHLNDKLREAGIELDRKQLSIPAPIKELGKHSTAVKLHPDVSVDLEFEVVSENAIVSPENSEDSE